MRRPTLRTSESIDSGIVSASNSSSTCSTYPKPPVKVIRTKENKTFDITHSRVNLPPPPPPPPPLAPPPPPPLKKKLATSTKPVQITAPKPVLPPRLPVPPPPTPIPASFTKQETPLPPIHMPSKVDEISTSDYTFAAPSSSAVPSSMFLKRKSSLLPIFVQSSCCTGLRNDKHLLQMSEEFDLAMGTEEKGKEKTHSEDYYHLLDFKQLVNRLPTPVVAICPPQGQDDYGMLFEQLDHIRETMPDVTVYDGLCTSGLTWNIISCCSDEQKAACFSSSMIVNNYPRKSWEIRSSLRFSHRRVSSHDPLPLSSSSNLVFLPVIGYQTFKWDLSAKIETNILRLSKEKFFQSWMTAHSWSGTSLGVRC